MCIRCPADISKRSRILSRSRKQYQSIEIAPRSSAVVPSQTRWDMIRSSSMWRTRRYLRARRDLELDQALDAAAEGLHLEEVGEVVHPLDERDDLPVALVLAGLLDPGVQVAHHRLQLDHPLALKRHDQPQHPVSRGVVRPHVDRQDLLLRLEARPLELPLGELGDSAPTSRAEGSSVKGSTPRSVTSASSLKVSSAITRTSAGLRSRCRCRGPARRRSGSRGAAASPT